MERQIENALAAKYAEDFKVSDVYFEKGLNLYVFEAKPTNKNITFQGQFDERSATAEKQLVKDSYPNYAFKAEATAEMEKTINGGNLGQYKAGATIASFYKHQFGNKLVSFEEYLKNRPQGSNLHFDLYLFETPSAADDKAIDGIREMIQNLQAKFNNNFFVKVSFWNKEVLGGKSVEDHSYGFVSTGEEDLDNVVNKLRHLKKELLVEITSGNVESLDNAKVFSLIKDRKPGTVNSTKI